MPAIDGLLLLGFGGPTPGCCGRRPPGVCSQKPGCEAECFVAGILGDNPARMHRIDEVVSHYVHTGGGFSPYNDLTQAQATALKAELARRGLDIPVELGFRHWKPWTKDGLSALAAKGCTKVGLLILAPHQSSVSWDWYLKHAAEAAEALGDASPGLVAVVAPWGTTPGYAAAIAEELTRATTGWDAARKAACHLIFTAHAIPQPVETTSPYRQQFAETARQAAALAGWSRHAIAFQSQPTDSRVPWSSPTIEQAIDQAKAAGATEVLVQPAGFLVDHTEVLFDLDHEAKDHCAQAGLGYTRATSVHASPTFIGMLADGVMGL